MSERALFTLVLWLLHAGTFFGWLGVFELAHRRDWFSRFRFDGGKAPPAELQRQSWKQAALDQLLFAPILWFVVWLPWRAMGGTLGEPWPDPLQVLWQLAVFILVQETIFYWSHRLIHGKWLFRHVHRQHHRYRHVRPISAEFAHPLETTFNLLALFAAPVLLGSHFLTVCIWMVLRISETVYAHSGYAFEGIGSRHAFHHRFPTKGCFGSFWGPWDPLMGTDREWKAWKAQQESGERQNPPDTACIGGILFTREAPERQNPADTACIG